MRAQRAAATAAPGRASTSASALPSSECAPRRQHQRRRQHRLHHPDRDREQQHAEEVLDLVHPRAGTRQQAPADAPTSSSGTLMPAASANSAEPPSSTSRVWLRKTSAAASGAATQG
jgi:hypothetical protein